VSHLCRTKIAKVATPSGVKALRLTHPPFSHEFYSADSILNQT
jgi:hypothetical protein